MTKYLVRVSEIINHDYIIEAKDRDEALAIYDSYTTEQLRDLDVDGYGSWDTPWDVEDIDYVEQLANER